MELLAFISFFFGASWDFFTEITVPGLSCSFATLFVGLFLAALGLKFLFMMLGITAPMGDAVAIARIRHDSAKGDIKRNG